ncbi:MAG: hypothetical protein MJ170_03250 [Alphaproteobacteria bacterium]|nr:hypothetical protein [Alphaproteobacteria bacterium]
MSNFNKFCLLFIVGMVYANTATAVDVSSQTANWGNGVLNTCGTNLLGFTDCIGISAEEDKITNPGETITWSCNTGKNMGIYSRAHDERAILMMVARQIKGNCAQFCPTQIEARNKKRTDTWTEYVDATPSNEQNTYCVWLCQGGDWSAISSDTDACDATKLSRETYTGIKSVTQGSDIKKSDIALFKNEDRVCGKNLKQEHNMFLSIDSITEHGAYVKQMVVRANYSGYPNMYSWPEVYPASNIRKILVCKIGYKPNAQETDCVEVSEPACAKQQMAPGFNDGQYDESIHKLFLNEKNEYEYRCKEAGYGFSPGAHTCEKCINNPIHDGKNPENDECVQCGAGKAFNPGAANSSYCSDMIQVDKTVLQYGNHKDKKFTDQCWTKDSSDYADCVKPALPKQ